MKEALNEDAMEGWKEEGGERRRRGRGAVEEGIVLLEREG